MNDYPELHEARSVDELGANRVLVTADLHLDEHSACARIGPGGVNTRLLWGARVVQQMAATADHHGVVAVYVLGDVFHSGKTALTATTADVAFAALADLLKVRSPYFRNVVLVGNHEQPDRAGVMTPLRALDTWPGVQLVGGVDTVAASGTMTPISAVAYRRDIAQLTENMRAGVELAGRRGLVLTHAGIRGGSVGVERRYFPRDDVVSLGTFRDEGGERRVRGVLSGHYHNHQVLHDGQVVYVGAPMQHTFGDEGMTGSFMLLDLDSLAYVRFATAAPTFEHFNVEGLREVKTYAKQLAKRSVPTYVRAKLVAGCKTTPSKVREALDGSAFWHQVEDERGVVIAQPETAEAMVAAVRSSMDDEALVRAYVDRFPPKWTGEEDARVRTADAVVRAIKYLGGVE